MEQSNFSGYPARVPAMRALVQRRIALRITGAVLWMGLWVAACTLWGRRSDYMTPLNWSFLGVLVGLLGWKLFKLGKILRDKPFEGTITSVKLAYVMHSDAPWTGRGYRQAPKVTVEVDIGDEKIKFRFPVDDIHPKNYYAVGDRVRHYRCLPYLEKADKPEDVCICVACGKYSYMVGDCCEFCKAPLLK